MNTVALFTSAWIETLLRLGQRPMSVCRTLHECVDWNPCWCCRVCDCYRVALFTSAWIETSYEEHAKPISESRTLHECVDWNKRTLTKAGLLTGRTLHECVDWNPWHENWATGCRQSHSSRVRGLRLMFISTSSQNNEDFWTYSLKRKKISSKENTWPKWVCPDLDRGRQLPKLVGYQTTPQTLLKAIFQCDIIFSEFNGKKWKKNKSLNLIYG